MDLNEILKRMFGSGSHPRHNRPPDTFLPPDEGDNDDQRDDSSFVFSFPGDNGRAGVEGMFGGDMFRQMNQMHRQMKALMRGFGSEDFGSPPDPQNNSVDPKDWPNNKNPQSFWFTLDVPSPFFESGHRDPSKPRSNHPRDLMLKEGFDDDDDDGYDDGGPGGRGLDLPLTADPKISDQDDNIGNDSALSEIMNLFEPVEAPSPAMPTQPRSIFSSSSTSSSWTRGPDGRVEEKRTVHKSDGSKETTVTRSSGGQSHTVTSVKQKDGTEERREALHNMDDNDLKAFDKLWHGGRPHGQLGGGPVGVSPRGVTEPPPSLRQEWGPHPKNDARSTQLPDMSPEDRDLFTKLFGDWK